MPIDQLLKEREREISPLFSHYARIKNEEWVKMREKCDTKMFDIVWNVYY